MHVHLTSSLFVGVFFLFYDLSKYLLLSLKASVFMLNYVLITQRNLFIKVLLFYFTIYYTYTL